MVCGIYNTLLSLATRVINFFMTDFVPKPLPKPLPTITTTRVVDKLKKPDLHDLCDATELAIAQDGGFGWLDVPDRTTMMRYWEGVTAVPQRDLFLGRADGTVAGTAQLVRQPFNNQAQSFVGQITTFFTAPWARGFGVGQSLLNALQDHALVLGLDVLQLDVRHTQTAAMALFEKNQFVRWGQNPLYARNKAGDMIAGVYYHKILKPLKGTK
jgi:ribosomal protein S18 acetylase RimI-like enzyme